MRGLLERVGVEGEGGGAGYQEPSVAAISRGGLLLSGVGGVVRLSTRPSSLTWGSFSLCP